MSGVGVRGPYSIGELSASVAGGAAHSEVEECSSAARQRWKTHSFSLFHVFFFPARETHDARCFSVGFRLAGQEKGQMKVSEGTLTASAALAVPGRGERGEPRGGGWMTETPKHN